MVCNINKNAHLIKEVGKDYLDFKLLKKEAKDWDLWWSDYPETFLLANQKEFVKNMLMHQRVNYFPGMHSFTKRSVFIKHMRKM